MKLQNKAMLVNLSISQWSARKHDKKVSKEVEAKYSAGQNAGRYNKVLIAQEEIKKVSKVANEARTFHYDNTLPWNDDGSRILPSANYLPYTQKIRELESAFQAAVNNFCMNYPAFVQDAKIRLNGLFNQADYPVESEILRKYNFAVQVNPIPDGQDFRVDLNNSEIKNIQQDIESRVETATNEAMRELWGRLYKTVMHMVDKLKDKGAVFRNSLVNNLCELVELLPRLNVTNDANLESMRKEIEDKLCQTDPDLLRADDQERIKTAITAQSILDSMAGYMGG